MSTNRQQHFAQVVLAAFDARGLTTDEMVRRAGGPSNTTMTVLRKVARGEAQMKEPRSDTARRIESAAFWKPGSVLQLWRASDLPQLLENRPPPFGPGSDEAAPMYPPLPPARAGGSPDPIDEAFRRISDLEDRLEVLEVFMERQEQHRGNTAPTSQATGSVAPAPSGPERQLDQEPADDELAAKRRRESIDRAVREAARHGQVEEGDEQE